MLHQLWHDLLVDLLHNHQFASSPRGELTREILGHQLYLEDLRSNILVVPHRNLNYRFMVAEWLWIAFGLNAVETLARYNSKMRQFSDDGVLLAGAYGPAISAQYTHVVDTLRRDPDSRQAVMSIWKPNPQPSKDIPCTLSHQFLVRDGRLHQITTMRSSDAWLGIPYDVFSFTQLANAIAGELGVETGSLTLNLGSAHLYQRDWENANLALTAIELGYGDTMRSPRLPGAPPRYSLLLVLEDPSIPFVSDVVLASTFDVWRHYAAALQSKTSKEALMRLGHAA